MPLTLHMFTVAPLHRWRLCMLVHSGHHGTLVVIAKPAAMLQQVRGFPLQGGATLCNRFSSLLAQQAARFEAGVALCGGRLLNSALPLADALPQRADPADVQRIELLCPPACAAAQAAGMCSVAEWLMSLWPAS